MDHSAPPFFRTLDALAVDDRRRRAGFFAGEFPHLDELGVMEAYQRAIPFPQPKILMHRAFGRQVRGQ